MEDSVVYPTLKIAHHLVFQEGYEVLHLDPEGQLIWLHKYKKRTSYLVRITRQPYYWANHLATSVDQAFAEAKNLKNNKIIRGKNVDVTNLYVAEQEPVDNWDHLQKPLQHPADKALNMNVYFLTPLHFADQLRRVQAQLNLQSIEPAVFLTEIEQGDDAGARQMTRELIQALAKREEKIKSVLATGKPYMTYLLIVMNLIMFIILEVNGSSTDTATLLQFGAKYNPALVDGEWWRLISSMFLHIGLLHLLMNMFALYYIGRFIEHLYGSTRFTFIYLVAGLGGGLASFAFAPSISAGASGAIFGLFGALLYFNVMHYNPIMQKVSQSVTGIILLNLVLGIIIPGIDVAAHLGGLVAGFLAAGLIQLPKYKRPLVRIGAIILIGLMFSGLTVYGIQGTEKSVLYKISAIEEALMDEAYRDVVNLTTTALSEESDYDALLLFQRSYAYIHLENLPAAITDLEESIAIDSDNPEAYYNLTLVYLEMGEDAKARTAIEEAVRLSPDNESFLILHKQIADKVAE